MKNEQIIKQAKSQLEECFRKIREHGANGNYADGATNARHALEKLLALYTEQYLPEAAFLKPLDQIDELKKAGIISGASRDTLHGVRKISNRGAHEKGEPVKPTELSSALLGLKKELEILVEYLGENDVVDLFGFEESAAKEPKEEVKQPVSEWPSSDSGRRENPEKKPERPKPVYHESQPTIYSDPVRASAGTIYCGDELLFMGGANGGTVYFKPTTPKPAVLLIVEKGQEVRTVRLSGSMKMGRICEEVKNDIVLTSGITSRNHGEFIYEDSENAYYYKDNNSLNGTYYNGTKLEIINDRGSKAMKLRDGDVLRIDRRELDRPHEEAVMILFSTAFRADEKWSRYALSAKEKEITIGRDGVNQIVLDDFMASRKHAVIKPQNGGWTLEDVQSKNGIAVNRQEISGKYRLHPMDVIRIANTSLIYTENEIIYNNVGTRTAFEERAYEEDKDVVLGVNINEVKVKAYASFKKKTLLKDIKMDIDAGDFVLILGGAGAGKTTFLKALLGEIRADGEILLGGMDLYKNFKMLKHKIGLVPQFSTTRGDDTVYNTIMDAATSKLSGEYSKEEIKKRVDEVIKKMMLTQQTNNLVKNLSGGQKKRVEVAMLSVGDQEVFILDEPDSGMDYATRMELMNNLKACTSSGNVVAVISHAPDEPAELFTKVIVLAKSQSDQVGHLAYYGDVPGAYAFFGVEKLSEIVMEINYEGGHGRADEFIEKYERIRGGK